MKIKRDKFGRFIGNKIYKEYNCKQCKKIISYDTTLYGSGLCRSCATKKQLKNPKNNGRYKDGFYTKLRYCLDCHKKLTNHSRTTYCKKCIEQYKIYPSRKGKNSYSWKGGLPHCKDCKKELKDYSNKRCQSCYLKTIKGKNHPCYINGRSNEPYPLEFNQTLREYVRKRDNYKCQKCGITKEEHIKKYNKTLEIHHIDYYKYNCKENNLITCCLSCNIKANFNRDYWFAYFTYIMENR
jgi:hypothetical protein